VTDTVTDRHYWSFLENRIKEIEAYGPDKVAQFKTWLEMFVG